MKKIAIAALAALMLATAVPAYAAPRRGGLVGGIVGCCFGIRTAGDYNDGKDI